MTKQGSQSASSAPSYIHPVYVPEEGGLVQVYAGDISLSFDGAGHQLRGNLEFRLIPRPSLFAYFSGRESLPADLKLRGFQPSVTLPAGTRPTPPTASTIHVRPDKRIRRSGHEFHISNIAAGDVTAIERVVIHGTNPVTGHPLPACETNEGPQGQLAFTLPGWSLRIAEPDEWREGEGFPLIVEAVPDVRPTSEEAIELLQRRLFVMLSFIAGREVGLVLIAGLDNSGQVVWGEWSSPRTETVQWHWQWQWCPDHLVDSVLPDLARGFSVLAADPTMEKVVDRAINLYLTANGTQPLDVRIPVACSGLELLAWAVLQTQRWLTTDAFDKLWAAANLRLLLHWARIPVAIPDAFTALEKRRLQLGQPDLAAPDVVLKIRNDLVHPPKRLTRLQWPTHDELTQAWRLTMNYLELVILRLIGYQGQYLPRLQLTSRWSTDTESVPWAT